MIHTKPDLGRLIDTAQNNRYAGAEIDVNNITFVPYNGFVDMNITNLFGSAFL